MADTYLPAEPLSDDDEVDEAASRYVEVLDRLEVGARVLRFFAYLAGAIWAVVTVSAAWFYWDQFGGSPASGSLTSQAMDNHQVLQVITAVAQTSWPYLAVAIIAYASSLLVDGRRLTDLLGAVTDDDDAEPDA